MTKARSLSDFIESDGSVTLVDNQQIKIGTGNDLVLKHTGSNSVIHNTTGQLRVRSDSLLFSSYSNEESYITATENGAVTLYYDNAVKLATTSTGVSVTGEIDLSDDINLAAGAARFGTGEDFSIYNDGSNTYLRNSTSNQDINFLGNDDGSANVTMLTLDASDGGTATFNHDVNLGDAGKVNFGAGSDAAIFSDGTNGYMRGFVALQNNAGDHDYISFVDGGATSLYHDNAVKLATTSSGVNVTGSITASGEFLNFSNSSFKINATSSQTGQIGFNRNPADGAHLGQSGFNRYQINGPFSGSDFLDFQNYNSSGTYLGGFRVEDGAIRAEPKGISEPSYSFDNDTDTGMTRPTSDTIQFVTGGAVGLRLNSDGLKFGSDTAAANSLNDYEEGTWTPAIVANSGTQPTVTFASGYVVSGYYTKIGRVVNVNFYIPNFTVTGTTSGTLNIGGLPYAHGAFGSQNGDVLSHYNVTFARGSNGNIALRTYSGTALGILSVDNGATWGWEAVSCLSGGGARYLTGSMTYMTDG